MELFILEGQSAISPIISTDYYFRESGKGKKALIIKRQSYKKYMKRIANRQKLYNKRRQLGRKM